MRPRQIRLPGSTGMPNWIFRRRRGPSRRARRRAGPRSRRRRRQASCAPAGSSCLQGGGRSALPRAGSAAAAAGCRRGLATRASVASMVPLGDALLQAGKLGEDQAGAQSRNGWRERAGRCGRECLPLSARRPARRRNDLDVATMSRGDDARIGEGGEREASWRELIRSTWAGVGAQQARRARRAGSPVRCAARRREGGRAQSNAAARRSAAFVFGDVAGFEAGGDDVGVAGARAARL